MSMFICHILSSISHFHASMLRWLDCLPSFSSKLLTCCFATRGVA